MDRTWIEFAAVLAVAIPVVAAPAATSRATLFENVTKCQVITDSAARLRCYDQAVPAIDAGERHQDVMIVDRAQVRDTRKTLFGLALPKLAIFSGKSADEKTEEVKEVESTLSAVRVDNYGHWLLTLADSAKWQQIDDNVVARRPRAGDKVVIKLGILGSYKMNITGQPAIRVHRVS